MVWLCSEKNWRWKLSSFWDTLNNIRKYNKILQKNFKVSPSTFKKALISRKLKNFSWDPQSLRTILFSANCWKILGRNIIKFYTILKKKFCKECNLIEKIIQSFVFSLSLLNISTKTAFWWRLYSYDYTLSCQIISGKIFQLDSYKSFFKSCRQNFCFFFLYIIQDIPWTTQPLLSIFLLEILLHIRYSWA